MLNRHENAAGEMAIPGTPIIHSASKRSGLVSESYKQETLRGRFSASLKNTGYPKPGVNRRNSNAKTLLRN